MHRLDAANFDYIGAGTVDISSHPVQAVGQIHNMGFPGNVFQNGLALRHDGSQHGIHRCAH